MNTNRLDRLTSAKTSRLTRRTALRGLGGGIAATGLTGLGLHRAAAQDATPSAATPASGADGEKTFFLFVQTAQAGTFIPKPGEEGVYQVTLEGADAQTIYFSDRPERIVGDISTDQFLDGLGFLPEDPPNAAIVAQTDAGEDILVVELLNPVWDEAAGTLTYDVRVLDDYQGEGLRHLAQQQEDGELPATFGNTSLFIDDCPDIKNCWAPTAFFGAPTKVGQVPGGPIPTCWSAQHAQCRPCNGEPLSTYGDLCNQKYPDACGEGVCFVSVL